MAKTVAEALNVQAIMAREIVKRVPLDILAAWEDEAGWEAIQGLLRVLEVPRPYPPPELCHQPAEVVNAFVPGPRGIATRERRSRGRDGGDERVAPWQPLPPHPRADDGARDTKFKPRIAQRLVHGLFHPSAFQAPVILGNALVAQRIHVLLCRHEEIIAILRQKRTTARTISKLCSQQLRDRGNILESRGYIAIFDLIRALHHAGSHLSTQNLVERLFHFLIDLGTCQTCPNHTPEARRPGIGCTDRDKHVGWAFSMAGSFEIQPEHHT
mmetsp:Transcript_6657/g.18192  ORF Transcript_6657/g.18192 Transcript_6657/m.18192 type:complete len:270 (-) Transcript_6657:3-812(-)